MAGFIAAHTIKKVIEVVDVDGVVRRIDVNDLVERIDVNHVVQRIDVNNVVERIDVDKAVSRIDIDRAVQTVDINALLNKVDWNKTVMEKIDFDTIIKKVDTSSIVLRSSIGGLDLFLDALRTHVVLLDLYLWVLARGRIFTKRTRQMCYLPPRPGTGLRQREDQELYPKGRSNKAVAVQGRYVGFLAKLLIMIIDMFTISLLFAMLWRLLEWCLMLFLGSTKEEAHDQTTSYQSNVVWGLVMYWAVYWFGYFFLCTWLTGQTLGMVIMGCKVVNCSEDGIPLWSRPTRYQQRRRRRRRQQEQYQHSYTVSAYQSLTRTLILPVTLTICPPLLVMGLYRRDGRMLHDWFAGTGIIYSWDATLAQMREKAQRDADTLATNDPMSGTSITTEASDEFDEWIEAESDSESISVAEDDRQGTDGSSFFSSRSAASEGQEVLLGEEPLLGSASRTNSSNNSKTKSVSFRQAPLTNGSSGSSSNNYETFERQVV